MTKGGALVLLSVPSFRLKPAFTSYKSVMSAAPVLSTSSTAAQYKKHTHREHILELPDTYIGSVDTSLESRWIWDAAAGNMAWRAVSFCPGFLKVFDEILVNALDHRVRMNGRGGDVVPVKHLDVTLTSTRIAVRNDGDGIPVETHAETGLWAPELIFGHLLTSSNYDKSEEKIVGGKNGYGAKLTNIFSSEFTIETVDHRAAKKYTQTWTSNMSVVGKPKVKACAGKPYTEIAYTPDLTRFNWAGGVVPSEIPEDMLAVIATRVVDAAACAGKDCRVTLNGVVLGHNTFPKYIGLFLSEDAGEGKHVAYESAGERWEVGAILTKDLHGDTPPDERHISFVNGIATRRGGKHVELVTRTVLTEFCAYAKRKAKLDLTPALLKDAVVFFINSTIVNPSFDTQTKETLTTPPSKFGSTPVISSKFIDALAKIGLLEEAAALLDAKTAKDAKKTDGKKKSTIRGIPKLDDATWAGTAKSADCTLILTEGDSAKTTAISGLKVVGREKYGVFPLKGKVLNVKDASADKKMKNVELTCIKQILGLEAGKKYTDLKQLRYGRVMIMTDQDVDGSHIKGLLMNLFHTEWPELLHLGFLCCLMTPLLKATRGGVTLCFYSESEYDAWKTAQTAASGADVLRGWHTKYYKGLGTSTAAEAREYFASMNTVEYTWDDASDGAIDLAFNKKRADDRKEWLETFDAGRHLEVTAGGSKVDYSRFVHDELIHFSVEDNMRSIPHVIDGLKPSQRKIFWSALKRNLFRGEIRVAQLAGYVSEHAAYHHGEASLTGAIVKMAQNFVGSNNLNLLAPNGQFGTRLMGGEDAASPRYIHTELMSIVKALVKKDDDAILDYTVDDGTAVEPVTYMPVLPLLLVNGATGIGTGFSTDVLPYNPKDLVGALKWRLSGGVTDLSSVELIPWWYGFKGRIHANEAGNGYITRGIYEFLDDDACTVRISELPVGTWTQDYKEYLETILVEQETALSEWKSGGKKKAVAGAGTGVVKAGRGASRKSADADAGEKPQTYLRGYTANYNDVDVDFVLELDPDYYHTVRTYRSEFEAKFKLSSSFRTTNMVAFNAERKITRYESAGAILEEFYGVRLEAYSARKAHLLAQMAAEILELTSRLTFIRAVVDKRLVVANAADDVLLAGLTGLGLPPLSGGEGLRGYEYLLKMRIDRIKASAVAELTAEVEAAKAKRDALEATTPAQLWLTDLDEFSAAWTDYTAWRDALNAETAAESRAAAAGKKVKKAKTAAKK
jgi:DNA topoisomerase-2